MPLHQRDYFAELYVAGLMGDNGWMLYSKRDVGFDFIATKGIADHVLIRPVQVKGPLSKRNEEGQDRVRVYRALYSFTRIWSWYSPFFPTDRAGPSPVCIAFMPRSEIRPQLGRGFKCFPAKFIDGRPEPRETFRKFFGIDGLRNMDLPVLGQGLDCDNLYGPGYPHRSMRQPSEVSSDGGTQRSAAMVY